VPLPLRLQQRAKSWARKQIKPRPSAFAKLRGRVRVRVKTDEIMALTRGA
jgi:hypothetical protein